MKNEFHMILPSDSSMDYHPENTASKFTTTLPQHVTLLDEWVVGLKEIQFPCSFLHIKDSSEGLVKYSLFTHHELPPETGFTHIPRGVYTDVNDMLAVLNNIPVMKTHFKFTYNKTTSTVNVELSCILRGSCDMCVHIIGLSPKLISMLGFDRSTFTDAHFMDWPRGRDNNELQEFSCPKPVSLCRGLPTNFFMYSDICAPYVTGNVNTSLLRIIPFNTVNYKYGTIKTISFSTINYIPLLTNSFRTIEIDIRDSQGEPIPFEYGPLNVTLHFKRIN